MIDKHWQPKFNSKSRATHKESQFMSIVMADTAFIQHTLFSVPSYATRAVQARVFGPTAVEVPVYRAFNTALP
jgi:hypothetical protein